MIGTMMSLIRGAALPVLAALLLAALVPLAHADPDWLTLGLTSRAGANFTRDPRFPTKGQTDLAVGGLIEFVPLSFLGIGTELGYHWTKPSNLDGGFRYRGHAGWDLRLYVMLRYLRLAESSKLLLFLGSNQGVTARLDHYDLTTLHFFYLGVFLHPYLELGLVELPVLSFQLSLPFEYYFRKDRDLSTSIGVGVAVRYSPLRKRWSA